MRAFSIAGSFAARPRIASEERNSISLRSRFELIVAELAGAVELVGAALGHDVDRAAAEVAIFGVERSELDLGLANRVIGNRGRTARVAWGFPGVPMRIHEAC